MKGRILFGCILLWVIALFMPRMAWAFRCGNTGQVIVDVNATVFHNQTVTFATNPGNPLIDYGTGGLSNSQNGVPAAPSGSGFYCALNYRYGDRVGITDITNIHSAISSSNYTATVTVGSTGISGSPGSTDYTFSSVVGACLLCGNGYDSWYRVNTPLITVKLNRTATWVAKPISNGDILFSLTVRRTDSNSAIGTIVFRMSGNVVYPTCNVKNFDNTVILPSVKRTDLVSHGSGRYTGVTKEFNINLECENTPKVNVTFDGDKISGVATDDVLMNKFSGNDNVGVQILYGSNPLKIGSSVAVLSAAGSNELLKFNAYYYYKGGVVQSGPIKSMTEFTFTYE